MRFTSFVSASLFAAALCAALPGAFPTARGQATPAAVTNPRRALSQIVRTLKVDGTSLDKVLNYLRDISGTNIVVNWKILETAGVTKDTPITLEVRELPLRKMLQLVLDQASPNSQLVYTIDSNVMQITTQDEADKQLITKVYIVDDLVVVPDNTVQAPRINLSSLTSNQNVQQFSNGQGGGGFGGGGFGGGGFGGGGFGGGGLGGGGGTGIFQQTTGASNATKLTSDDKGKELVDLITSVIRPSIWKDPNGGPATIRYFSGKLIVTAPASVHEAIGGPVEDTSSGAIRFGS